jgi:hypothetical protein
VKRAHLRHRSCSAFWRCAVCPRDAAHTIQVEGTGFLVVLCRGCFLGLDRVLDSGSSPAEFQESAP